MAKSFVEGDKNFKLETQILIINSYTFWNAIQFIDVTMDGAVQI